MERSTHRLRSMPTQDLVAELVSRLVDAMQTEDLALLDSPRAARVLRELRGRIGETSPLADGCTCAQCAGDLYEGERGPDPF